MNEESQIKLQAYVDGELPAGEAAEVREWLARDAGARALETELRNTKAALAGGETAVKLPETREFYWSKIRGEIERQDLETERAAAAPPRSWWSRWGWRGLVPAGAFAVVCLMALRLAAPGAAEAEFVPELDLASDDMGAYTYRNQENGLTMIWLYDRDNGPKTVQVSRPPMLATK